ncbi:peroxidase-like, partial [Schistocerca cancellata]|uniref:peroxidase-like n=1 Tax=Schistocerca cancellata TaxID=274614 RepID=UPI002118AE04
CSHILCESTLLFLNCIQSIVLLAAYLLNWAVAGPECLLLLPPDATGRKGCVTAAAVDEAFSQARRAVGLDRPPREPTPVALDLLGAALHETTRLLANRYGLSRGDIGELSRVDTLRTSVLAFCPPHLQKARLATPCPVIRYRRYDGACNNLRHPQWGATGHPFRRLLPPDYADGVSAPRASSRSGFPLPNARRVSAAVHSHRDSLEHAVTMAFVAWGQMLDHDLTQTAETKASFTQTDPDCCGSDRGHRNCLPLSLPRDDAFYRQHGQTCMSVLRSSAAVPQECRLGPRAQLNEVTSYIDAGFVYGSGMRLAYKLRTRRGGQMRTLRAFPHHGLKDLLPLKVDFPDEGCIRPRKDIFCFLAGDIRVNEQLILTVLHTALVREHNRIAKELSYINPHWSDEKLYQETRHIIAALVQHITYHEFLPMLLGRNSMEKHELLLLDEGYLNKYDPMVDATMTSSFVTAAFRFGHSLLPNVVQRWSVSHRFIGAQRLSGMLKQPFDLYKPGRYDQYVMGMINQVPQAMDDGITQEVTNHLFQKPTHHYGMDLASLNILRAREHGIPSYNEFREFCGLQRMDRFSSMLHIMDNATVGHYHKVYDHPDDVDLWSAGVAERPLPGSMVGPTFNCIISKMFHKLKFGDRFWYENDGWPSMFSLDQLKEIRKVRLSRLLCDSGDEIQAVQLYAMVLPDSNKNPRVTCNSKLLPRLDLTKWKDQSLQDNLSEVRLSEEILPDNETEVMDPNIDLVFQVPDETEEVNVTDNFVSLLNGMD